MKNCIKIKSPRWKKEIELYEGNKSIVYTLDLTNKTPPVIISLFLNEVIDVQNPTKMETEVEACWWADENGDSIELFNFNLSENIKHIDKTKSNELKTKAIEMVMANLINIMNDMNSIKTYE